MEVDEEDDLNELCAEILENWQHPNVSENYAQSIAHQNPFSLHNHNYNHPPHFHIANETDHMRKDNEKEDKIDTSVDINTNGDDLKFDFDMEQKDQSKMDVDATMTVNLKTTNEKSSQSKMAKKIKNGKTDQSIIPILVTDTFYDKWLKCSSDGIDLEALKSAQGTIECDKARNKSRMCSHENNAGASTDRKKLNLDQKSSQLKCSLVMQDRGSPKTRYIPASNIEAHKEITSCLAENRVSFLNSSLINSLKSRFVLPSNKTIFDIDIDSLEKKLWRNHDVDTSDFFNYGLDEKQWKAYSKLMQERAKIRSSVHSKVIATKNGSRNTHKEERAGEKITTSRENEHMKEQLKEKVAFRCRNINAGNISPFPMDFCSPYSIEEGEVDYRISTRSFKANSATDMYSQIVGQNMIAHNISRQQHQLTYNNKMVSITKPSDDTDKRQVSRKTIRKNKISGRNIERVRLYLGDQKNHQTSEDLVDYLRHPKVKEFVRNKKENYVSEVVKNEHVGEMLSTITNDHDADPKKGVEGLVEVKIKEDPERLKRRSERFKLHLPVSKKVQADTSMENETNSLPYKALLPRI